MERRFFALFAGMLLTIPAGARGQAPNRGSGSSRAVFQGNLSKLMSAEGSEINATLLSSLDSRTAKPGDEIAVRATETIRVNGAVVPRGAKLIGHVTRASARSNGNAESEIGIVFDKAVLKNGKEIAMRGGINALASEDAEPVPSALQMSSVEGTYGNTIEGAVNTIAYSTSRVPHAVPKTFGGLAERGLFIPDSRGVFGVYGLSLGAAGSNDTDGAVITSTGSSVHVKSGARLLVVFRVQDGTSKSAAI